MRALLDTSIVIALTQANPPSLDGFVQTAISSVTYAELDVGVNSASTELQRSTRASAVSKCRSLFGAGIPFDDVAAVSYGILFGLARSRSRTSRMHVADFMIAAVAHSLGVPLITRNAGDLHVVADIVQVVER